MTLLARKRLAARLGVALSAVMLSSLASTGPANASPTLGRTIPLILTPTYQRNVYTVGPDDTFWLAGGSNSCNGGAVTHLDQNGKALSDGFTIKSSDYVPLGIAYYHGRVYVLTGACFSTDHLYSWIPGAGSTDPGLVFSDYFTGYRIGSNGAGLRAFGSGAFIPAGISNKVVTADLSNVVSDHPFYPQSVMGWGVTDNHHPGNGFEFCQAGPPPANSPSAGNPACINAQGDPSTVTDDGPGHINDPVDVAAGPNGVFYVLEFGKNRVARFDEATGPNQSGPVPSIRFGASGGSAAGHLDGPLSIVRDPSTGHLFISEYNNRRISEFDPVGNFVEAFGWGVLDGSDRFEVCTTSCQAGRSDEPRTAYSQLNFNSTGELYAETGNGSGGTVVQVISLDSRTPTSTSVSCTPKSISAGGDITCTATVSPTRPGSKAPGGPVDFSSAGAGVYGGSGSCFLASTKGSSSASCHTRFVPVVIGRGSHTVLVTASYLGTPSDKPSKGTTDVSAAGVPAPATGQLVLSVSVFRAAGRGGSVGTAAAKRIPVGTLVYFKLTKATTVVFTVSRPAAGRKVKSREKIVCLKPTKSNQGKPRCTLYVPVKGSFKVKGHAGINVFRFTGRLGGRKLSPGSYRLTGTPGPGGGPPAVSGFRIAP